MVPLKVYGAIDILFMKGGRRLLEDSVMPLNEKLGLQEEFWIWKSVCVCVCVRVRVTRSAYTCAMSIFLYLENYAIYFGDQMMYTIVHNSTSFKYCYNRYEIISVIITIINVS